MSEPPPFVDARARELLLSRGFLREQIPLRVLSSPAWARLRQSYDHLSRDDHYKDGVRFRSFNRFRVTSHGESVSILPGDDGRPYVQSAEYNPVFGALERNYRPNPSVSPDSDVLVWLVADHLSLVAGLSSSTVFDAHVHCIRFAASAGNPCNSSPPGYHKDGEPYSGIYLVRKAGIVGGVTSIADNELRELTTFSLGAEGEGYFFIDSQVYHAVSEMRSSPGGSRGVRDIVNIDFIPR